MKKKTVFFCTECGNETAKWAGQCPACGAWNTLTEAPAESRAKSESARPRKGGAAPQAAIRAGHPGGDTLSHRHGRAGQGIGWRRGEGQCGARGRRARGGQVHAVAAALRPGRGERAHTLCHRRGEPPPAEDARAEAGRLRGRHICPGGDRPQRDRLGHRERAAHHSNHRLHPDHV